MVQDVPLEYIFPLLDVPLVVVLLDGQLGLFEGILEPSIQFAYQEDQLQDAAQSDPDVLLAVAGVVLGEDQFRPELLHDPMAEVVVLVEVDLLSHLCLVESPINRTQLLFDNYRLSLEVG